jgi:PIN domain
VSHCEERSDEAISIGCARPARGLLRFARNDGVSRSEFIGCAPLFCLAYRSRNASLVEEADGCGRVGQIAERIVACRDPTDDKFLELAVNGHADLIVSGDGDLLALNPFRDIPIVTPAAFVQGWPGKDHDGHDVRSKVNVLRDFVD